MTDPARVRTHSDRDTTNDLLNYSDYKAALGQILEDAETPLTIGVFGAWGSGKTSLMRMLHDEFAKKDRVRTVWFTAWKYDKQDALWRAFILRVISALYPRKSGEGPREEREKSEYAKEHPLMKLLERMEESVYSAVTWEEMGAREINWLRLVGYLSQPAIALATGLATGDVATALKGLEGQKLVDAVGELRQKTVEMHRHQLQHMEQFENTFEEAIKTSPHERLIVFVDDLDRCLPEKAIEVLEAIKLFLEVQGVVFVLGMDPAVIERGLEQRYAKLPRTSKAATEEREELPVRGDVYLHKIVQVPFNLPPLDVEEVASYIDALETGDDRLDEVTRQVFALGTFPNPRQVKRLLNIFRLLRVIAQQRGIGNDILSEPLLAKAVIIQSQYPNLYNAWRTRHTLIRTLEESYQSRPTTELERVRGFHRELAEEGDVELSGPRKGDILEPFLTDRSRYWLLERMLLFPAHHEDAEGAKQDANRLGLTRFTLEVTGTSRGSAAW